ncbi:MAG: hypothetical protein GC168_20165 [Candidatus Hydrogenedens sp.]|nr:hypothetical protein [Candidatus Hydrogenedens sp.]
MFESLIITLSVLLSSGTDSVSLFKDPGFAQGFNVSSARSLDQPNELGPLQTSDSSASPSWRLAQWGTRYVLPPSITAVAEDGVWSVGNEAKRITIHRHAASVAQLSLRLNGIMESNEQLRAKGEPWPHLLIEQRLGIDLAEMPEGALRLAAELRISDCRPAYWARKSLDPALHTAQVSAYFMVHRRHAPGEMREAIWFGIPFFDARHEIPPGHFAMDIAESGDRAKFIACLEGERFWKGPTGDGQWHTLDADIVALLGVAVRKAQEQGHLEGAAVSDLVLDSFNLGWEVTGPYDATLDIRGLRLNAAASTE